MIVFRQVLAEVTVSAQAAERVKAQVQKVKDKAQKIVDEISASETLSLYVEPAVYRSNSGIVMRWCVEKTDEPT